MAADSRTQHRKTEIALALEYRRSGLGYRNSNASINSPPACAAKCGSDADADLSAMLLFSAQFNLVFLIYFYFLVRNIAHTSVASC